MSKFRARQLDATKPIPIYLQEDICDYTDLNNASNRTVPQMPTGMEKEEETEHHLQQAIFHHRVIPVPEVYSVDNTKNGKIYPTNYKQPRQLIHIHPFSAEQDIPDYDLDSEDEAWLSQQAAKGDLLPLLPPQFEEMMDRLEKSSGLKAVTLQEAKVLLKDDDDLITAVYDYWLNKRLRLQHALIPQVKTEKGLGSAPSDPYVAFRKRTEKMQTRKNRKNDESSYEKMLKLRRDLSKSLTMLQMVSRREKTKRELLHLQIEIFEKRYELQDWSGGIMSEVLSSRAQLRAAFAPLASNHLHHGSPGHAPTSSGAASSPAQATPTSWLKLPSGHHSSSPHHNHTTTHRDKEKNKRERKHRKLKQPLGSQAAGQQTPLHLGYQHPPDPYLLASAYPQGRGGEEDGGTGGGGHSTASPSDDDSHPDGSFTFVRKHHCQYYAPREDGLWSVSHDGGSGGPASQFSLISLPHHYRPHSPSQQCSPPAASPSPPINRLHAASLQTQSSSPSQLSSQTQSSSSQLSSQTQSSSQFSLQPQSSLSSQSSFRVSSQPHHLSSSSLSYHTASSSSLTSDQHSNRWQPSEPSQSFRTNCQSTREPTGSYSPPKRHIALARRRMGRGGRVWVDRIGLCPPSAEEVPVREHNGLASHSVDLLARLHTAAASWSSSAGAGEVSRLSAFVAPACPGGGAASDADTDLEVDVESVASPRRARQARLSPPLSLLLSAEMLDGSYVGSSSEIHVTHSFAGLDNRLDETDLTGDLEQGPPDNFLDSAAPSPGSHRSEDGSCAAWSRGDSTSLTSRGGFNNSRNSSFNMLPVMDSSTSATPVVFMEGVSEESSSETATSSTALSSHHNLSSLRGGGPRRSVHASQASPQHSSQFTLQPSSKFVVVDPGGGGSSVHPTASSFHITPSNPPPGAGVASSSSTYHLHHPTSIHSSSTNCDSDLVNPSHSLSSSSSVSTPSLLLQSSSSFNLNSSNRQNNTLSNQSCSNFVVTTTNSTTSSSLLMSCVPGAVGSSGGLLLTTTTSKSSAPSKSPVAWSSDCGVRSSGAIASSSLNSNSESGVVSSVVGGVSCGEGGLLLPATIGTTNSFSGGVLRAAGDSLLLTATTTTSDNNNSSSDSGLVNSVDSRNKLTSISSTPVSTPILQSRSAAASGVLQQRGIANNATFSLNNSSGHEVVYLNTRSTNNGNSFPNNSTSLRSHHKVLTARTSTGVVSSASINLNNSHKNVNTSTNNSASSVAATVAGGGGGGGDVVLGSNTTTNSSALSNGPSSRNSVILTKANSTSSSSNPSIPPNIKCAKLDQYIYRDS